MSAESLPAGTSPPAFNEEGVDLTLIRWTLSLTPAERLQTLQDFIDSITEMRRGSEDA